MRQPGFAAGWRAVFKQYSAVIMAFAAVWHLFAANQPEEADAEEVRAEAPPPVVVEPVAEPLAPTAAVEPAGKGPTVEWRIFKVPSVLVAIGCKGTSGLPEYCLTQWLPTIFLERCVPTPCANALCQRELTVMSNLL